MRLTTVAILCPGPSLYRHTYFEATHVVCVGSAVLHAWDGKHAWCTHSPVPEDQMYADRLIRSGAEVWCSEDDVTAYRDAYAGVSDVYPHHRTPAQVLTAAGLPALLKYVSTTHIAMAECVSRGAVSLTMYGMDLYGSGAYDPNTGHETETPQADAWWEARWKREKETFETIVESLKEIGVEVQVATKALRVI